MGIDSSKIFPLAVSVSRPAMCVSGYEPRPQVTSLASKVVSLK